jgi:hypothetical protein
MGVAVAVILLITVCGCGAAIRTGHQENNLRLRPHAPNKGRGRLQVQIRRAFVGYHLLSSSQVYDYALARVRGDAWRRRHRWSVTRVLDQLCHRVGRAPTRGRPWLWRPSIANTGYRWCTQVRRSSPNPIPG